MSSLDSIQGDILKNNIKGILGVYSKEFNNCKTEWRGMINQNQRTIVGPETLEYLYFKLDVLKNEVQRFIQSLNNPTINIPSTHPHLQSLKRYLTPDVRRHQRHLISDYTIKASRLSEKIESLKERITRAMIMPPRG